MSVTKITPRRFGDVEHPALGVVQIRMIRERLTDGSYVHNVLLGGTILLHAIDEKNANELATTIARAIDDLTVDAAEIVS